jgi:23S rRNA pseudouridine1911/1915/1917 synthase
VDKPAGTPAHPAGGRQSATLIQGARAAYRERISEALARGDESFYPSLVHRLDTFTSGVALIAKTRDMLLRMHALAASGGILKEYLAVVEGTVEPETGRIDMSIGPAEGGRVRIRMQARPDGKPAVTEYEVLRRLPGHTLLKARPLTGRTHQIRVHLAATGHPVWGDLIYKDESLFLRYWENGLVLDASLPPRHLLHAARVCFTHPFSGQAVEIKAPVPADFASILRGLEERL